MKSISIFLCLLTLVFAKKNVDAKTKQKEVIHIFAITRHGARAPTHKTSMSILHKNFKDMETGELSSLGKHSGFIYGRKLREQYPDFFKNVTMEADNFNAVYHDKERIKDTASEVMDGIFGNYRNFDPTMLNNELVWPPFFEADIDYKQELKDFKEKNDKKVLKNFKDRQYDLENLTK